MKTRQKPFAASVFLSRPTTLAERFKPGFELFEKQVAAHRLEAATLGINFHSINTPMSTLKNQMKRYQGAIILGFPHEANPEGPSPWNHIEATLAYSNALPLLIICDKKLSGGVFDPGALPKMIFKADLATADWPETPAIRGALKVWARKVTAAARFAPEAKLEIVEARWGGLGLSTDVAARLTELIVENRIRCYAGNDLAGGDPAPLVSKTLTVSFRWKGKIEARYYPEYKFVKLP